MWSKFFKQMALGIAMIGALIIRSEVVYATTIVPIGPGDRIFMRGDQWIRNGTGYQLEEFEVINLSGGSMTNAQLKAVTDTLEKKLFIGLNHDHLVPDFDDWPIDVINDYEDSLSTDGGFLMTFKNKIVEWTELNIPVSAVMFNQEIPDTVYFEDSVNVNGRPGKYSPEEYAGRHTALIKKYKEILLQYSPDTELWVFGSPTAESYFRNGVHWDSLTMAPNAVDVCLIGETINTSYVYGTLQERKDDITNDVVNPVKNIVNANGKPVVAQVGNYSASHWEIRDAYHLYWNDYRALVSHLKSATSSSSYSMNNPSAFWFGEYTTPLGSIYTQDSSGSPPDGPLPWADGDYYPARFWEDGEVGNWGYNKTHPAVNKHNKREREFVANFLKATGNTFPGHTLSSSQTWRGTVYLIGDVVIPDGVTLTIEAGTTINFRPDTDVYEAGQDDIKAEIIVEGGGTLYAVGSVNSPIVFQSSFRADENDTPSNDDWVGIRVEEGGTLYLQNAAIYDAKVGVDVKPSDTEITIVDIRQTDFWWNDKGIKIQPEAQPPEVVVDNIGMFYNLTGLETQTYTTSLQNDIGIINWTLSDNLKGLRLVSLGSEDQQFQIKNAIFAFNTYAADADYPSTPTIAVSYSDFYQHSTTFIGDISGWSVPPSGTGNLDDDPEFADRNGYDYHLDSSSPLLDAGDPGMSDPDQSVIEMGRYGGTSEHTPSSLMKPVVLQTESEPELPDAFAVGQNFPNPFNPETTIAYALPQASDVRLVIYSALGQEVRTLIHGVRPAGFHRIVWDSRDNMGRQVSSGIYLYRLVAGEFLDTRKMLILK